VTALDRELARDLVAAIRDDPPTISEGCSSTRRPSPRLRAAVADRRRGWL